MVADKLFNSRLLQAKQRRKEVAHDVLLLSNRIALLKAEEEKAWKKIEKTKQRAMELLRLREENERKSLERQSIIRKSEKSIQLTQKSLRTQSLGIHKIRDAEDNIEQKKQDVQSVKEEKQRWRKMIESDKQSQLEEAVRKRELVFKHEENLRKLKLQKQAELERITKEREEKKIREEENCVNEKQLEVKHMEKLEMELIQRVRNTQHLQKQAYRELENALSATFSVSTVSSK